VVAATLRASSLGIYEAWVNGHAAGDDVLSPGWSSKEWRVRYGRYDVTALITDVNVLGMSLGNGWYAHRRSRPTERKLVWTDQEDDGGKFTGCFLCSVDIYLELSQPDHAIGASPTKPR
jgi:hypothetical protein